jgi:hypothetical protein
MMIDKMDAVSLDLSTELPPKKPLDHGPWREQLPAARVRKVPTLKFALEKRLGLIEGNTVELGRFDACVFEAEPRRPTRRLVRVLDPVEPLFLDSSDDLAVSDKHGGGVVIPVERQIEVILGREVEATSQAKDDHGLQFTVPLAMELLKEALHMSMSFIRDLFKLLSRSAPRSAA